MTAFATIQRLNWGYFRGSPARGGGGIGNQVVRYGLGIAFAGLGLVARLALDPFFPSCDPFPPFLVAVIGAHWLCGLGPCLVTLALGTVAGSWFFVHAGQGLVPRNPSQWFDLLTYLVAGSAIAFYGWARQQAEDRLSAEVQQRIATEEALRSSEARFRGYAQSTQDVIWIVDPAGRHFEHLSPAFETVWGRSRTGLEPMQWLETIHPEDRPAVRSALNPAEPGTRPRLEYRIIRPDRSVRWISDSGFPIYDEAGRLSYLVGIARDITEQKELEEMLRSAQSLLEQRVQERTADLQKSIQAMREFTYSIAHNLFAPLRAAHGFTELLLTRHAAQLDEQGRAFGRRITDAATRMSRLLESLLAYGRVASMDASLAPLRTDEVLEKALQRVRELPQGEQARFHIQPPLPAVQANPELLAEVLFHLLRNALQFALPGIPPQVVIRAEVRQDSVRLCIQDNGVGIDPAFHAEIFAAFSRLSQDASGSTGMGLAIVQKAMDRMHGRVGLESRPGTGSCFWLEFPQPGEASKPPLPSVS